MNKKFSALLTSVAFIATPVAAQEVVQSLPVSVQPAGVTTPVLLGTQPSPAVAVPTTPTTGTVQPSPAVPTQAIPTPPANTNGQPVPVSENGVLKNILGDYVKADTPVKSTDSKPTTDEIIYRTNIGRADDVALLIKRGASPNEVNESGVPLLSLAANRLDAEGVNVVKVLLEAGADVNKKDKRGQTALFYTAKTGNKEIAEYLLKKGISYSTADNFGNNARNTAYQANKNNIVELLDGFIKNQNEESRRQYDEANKQLKESYASFKNAIRQEQERRKTEKKFGVDGKLIAMPSMEKIPEIVHDISFASCAATYWQFCSANNQETELNKTDLAANIASHRSKVTKLSQSFVKDYAVGYDMVSKIIDISQSQVGSQLSNMQTNSARERQGVGKVKDMNTRCRSIADIWTAVSEQ